MAAMKLIRIMDYNDPHTLQPTVPEREFARVRRAARAVVSDDDGRVYLMHARNHGYYKLPGGGINEGESNEAALDREIHEEMGAWVEITGEVGQTIQYDEVKDFRQDSYCYRARLVGELGRPELTDSEAEAGFEVARFRDFDAAIAAISATQDKPPYAFMTVRDTALLEVARQAG